MANEIDSNTLVITKKAIELVSTEMKYHLSTEKVAPAIDDTWLDSPPVMEGEYKYLWAYYIYTYSNETVVTSDPVLIGTTATSPLVCYVEPDSFILPSDEYGYVSDYKNNVQSVISLLQSESGETKLLTYDSALSANGTYNITFTASGISFCELDGSLFKATDGTTMAGDTATVVLTINYLDYYGEKGTIQKTISVVKNKQGQTGAYTIKQWCISDSATSPGDSPEWLDDMPVLANSNKYVWYRSKDIPKGTDPDTVEWGTPELETTLRLNMADSSLLIGQHEVALSGKRILLNGSVSADQLEAELLIAQDLQITDGLDKDGNVIAGKIRSYGYEKGDVEDSTKTASGFYMDNNGNLEAINASFKNAQTYNLTMVGGEILGENNPLNTLVSSSGEASFKNNSSNAIYVKSSDLVTLIRNNLPSVDYVTQNMIDAGGGGVLRLGSITYPYVAKVLGTSITLESGAMGDWNLTTTGSDFTTQFTCTYTFSFTLPCPAYANFTYAAPFFLYVGSIGSAIKSMAVFDTILYKRDSEDWVTYQSEAGDKTSGDINVYLSTYFSTSGAHTVTVKHISEAKYTQISSSPQSGLEMKIAFSAKSSYSVAYLTAENFVYITESFLGNYVDAYYSYGSVNSSSLTKYSPFTGIQRSTGGSYSYYSVAGAISAKNLILNGISKGEAVVMYNLTSISINQNGTQLLSISSTDYLASTDYPTFSFTALDSSKGVYVDDLFVKVNSSGNYKGSGNIGSAGRPFHYIYADMLIGKSAYLSNTLQCGSVDTDSIVTNSIQASSLSSESSLAKIYDDSNNGFLELGEKNSSNPIKLYYDGYLRFKFGDTLSTVKITSSGVYGTKIEEYPLYTGNIDSIPTTINLNKSVTNYNFIYFAVGFGSNGGFATRIIPASWYRYFGGGDAWRLVISTDSYYTALYFASDTQIVVNSKNANPYFYIHGIQ